MKAGVVNAIMALKILHDLGFKTTQPSPASG
jgi:hypothetical protein